jgi:hypothetical protein
MRRLQGHSLFELEEHGLPHHELASTFDVAGAWQAETLGRLGVSVAPLLCIHGTQIQHDGLPGQGVAIVPATLPCTVLGYDRVLSDSGVERDAATARMRPRTAF